MASLVKLQNGLTIQQERFAQAMVENGCRNREQAFRYAYDCDGMSASSIRSKASRVFHREHVQNRILELLSDELNAEGITRNYLLSNLKKIIDGPDTRVKIRAMELASKILGLHTDASTINLNQAFLGTANDVRKRVQSGVTLEELGGDDHAALRRKHGLDQPEPSEPPLLEPGYSGTPDNGHTQASQDSDS